MLYILAVIIIVSLLLNPVSVKAGFFEKEDTSVQESGCSECSKETVNLNADLKANFVAVVFVVSLVDVI